MTKRCCCAPQSDVKIEDYGCCPPIGTNCVGETINFEFEIIVRYYCPSGIFPTQNGLPINPASRSLQLYRCESTGKTFYITQNPEKFLVRVSHLIEEPAYVPRIGTINATDYGENLTTPDWYPEPPEIGTNVLVPKTHSQFGGGVAGAISAINYACAQYRGGESAYTPNFRRRVTPWRQSETGCRCLEGPYAKCNFAPQGITSCDFWSWDGGTWAILECQEGYLGCPPGLTAYVPNYANTGEYVKPTGCYKKLEIPHSPVVPWIPATSLPRPYCRKCCPDFCEDGHNPATCGVTVGQATLTLVRKDAPENKFRRCYESYELQRPFTGTSEYRSCPNGNPGYEGFPSELQCRNFHNSYPDLGQAIKNCSYDMSGTQYLPDEGRFLNFTTGATRQNHFELNTDAAFNRAYFPPTNIADIANSYTIQFIPDPAYPEQLDPDFVPSVEPIIVEFRAYCNGTQSAPLNTFDLNPDNPYINIYEYSGIPTSLYPLKNSAHTIDIGLGFSYKKDFNCGNIEGTDSPIIETAEQPFSVIKLENLYYNDYDFATLTLEPYYRVFYHVNGPYLKCRFDRRHQQNVDTMDMCFPESTQLRPHNGCSNALTAPGPYSNYVRPRKSPSSETFYKDDYTNCANYGWYDFSGLKNGDENGFVNLNGHFIINQGQKLYHSFYYCDPDLITYNEFFDVWTCGPDGGWGQIFHKGFCGQSGSIYPSFGQDFISYADISRLGFDYYYNLPNKIQVSKT